MITYVKGELTEVYQNTIIVECYGIGYEIIAAGSVMDSLPAIGSEVKIYTYQNVKEDALDLFGFACKDDLDVFKLLITVSGIGPKGALSILSYITPDELRMAVISDDVKKIQKAPGIGGKTAQKLIIELKDKLSIEDVIYKQNEPQTGTAKNVSSEAIEALISLGYSNSEAVRAVKSITITDDMDSEAVLRLALKKMI